jgi:hypothetical protein
MLQQNVGQNHRRGVEGKEAEEEENNIKCTHVNGMVSEDNVAAIRHAERAS